jgi:hypothetical protein
VIGIARRLVKPWEQTALARPRLSNVDVAVGMRHGEAQLVAGEGVIFGNEAGPLARLLFQTLTKRYRKIFMIPCGQG